MNKTDVKAAVERYLTNTFISDWGYTVKMDYPFKILKVDRVADVALLTNEKLIVIALVNEQSKMSPAAIENRIQILKSYLLGFKTLFGLYADSVSPDNWTYLQRTQLNWTGTSTFERLFSQHSRATFERLVIQGYGQTQHQTTSKPKTTSQETASHHTQHAKDWLRKKTEDEIREIVHKDLQATLTRLHGENRFGMDWWNFEEEYYIQIGSKKGYADLVLLLNNVPFVIVECKRQGLVEYGKAQLESYLNASRAQLGIFANDPKPERWFYYDNSFGFNEIPRDRFNQQIRAGHKTEQDIEEQAQQYKVSRIEARASELVTEKAIQDATVKIVESEARKRVTETAIQGSVQNFHTYYEKLLKRRTIWAFLGWNLFFMSLFILIVVLFS